MEEKLAVTHTEQNTAKMAALVFALFATRASGARQDTQQDRTQEGTHTHTHTETRHSIHARYNMD